MIKLEAWQELVATLAARSARYSGLNDLAPITVVIPYEEIESAPGIEVTWDRDREVVEILVQP